MYRYHIPYVYSTDAIARIRGGVKSLQGSTHAHNVRLVYNMHDYALSVYKMHYMHDHNTIDIQFQILKTTYIAL